MRIGTWNVNAWTLENSNIRSEILSFIHADIIFVIESKVKNDNVIEMVNYTWFGFNRKHQRKTAKCGSGGVGIFIKTNILNEWLFDEIDKSVDGLYITCLTNKITNYKIVLIPCYLPPENSEWGAESEHFFSHLTSILYSIDNVDIVIGGGDFNARISNSLDYILDIDDVPERKVLDFNKNKHGESFLNFLLESKLCVTNGRIQGHDNFTFITPQGKSVVDYFFTHIDSINFFKHMYVEAVNDIMNDMSYLPTSAVPDHSLLIIDVCMSEFNHIKENENRMKNTISLQRRYKVDNIPNDFMNNDNVQDKITSFLNENCQEDPSQLSVNNMYSEFMSILENEMQCKLATIEPKKAIKGNHSRNKPFWNEDLKKLFKETSKAQRKFSQENEQKQRHILRLAYKEKQSIFDKAFRKAKSDFLKKKSLK